MKTSGFQGHELVQAGRFVVGCNYWASHAGTRMWEDWRPDIVTRDLRRLEQGGASGPARVPPVAGFPAADAVEDGFPSGRVPAALWDANGPAYIILDH